MKLKNDIDAELIITLKVAICFVPLAVLKLCPYLMDVFRYELSVAIEFVPLAVLKLASASSLSIIHVYDGRDISLTVYGL